MFLHPSSLSSKYKFVVPSFTCGSWDNVVQMIIIMMLLFGVGRLVETVQIRKLHI